MGGQLLPPAPGQTVCGDRDGEYDWQHGLHLWQLHVAIVLALVIRMVHSQMNKRLDLAQESSQSGIRYIL